jgi:hypothetical protein
MRIYQIRDDFSENYRWYLKSPTTELGVSVDPWVFTRGSILNIDQPLLFSLRRQGRSLDFTLAAFDIPVLSSRLMNSVKESGLGDVQWISAHVESSEDKFYVVNTLEVYQCLDLFHSKAVFWEHEDGIPQKTGQIRRIESLFLHKDKIPEDAFIFRVQGLEARILCTDKFSDLIRVNSYTGIEFEEIGLTLPN